MRHVHPFWYAFILSLSVFLLSNLLGASIPISVVIGLAVGNGVVMGICFILYHRRLTKQDANDNVVSKDEKTQ